MLDSTDTGHLRHHRKPFWTVLDRAGQHMGIQVGVGRCPGTGEACTVLKDEFSGGRMGSLATPVQ